MKQTSLGLPLSSRRGPWAELVSLIEPYAPEAGRRGQQPFGVEVLLRIHFMHVWTRRLLQAPLV